ncbi:MAG TPA: hypothetical protein VK805_19505 [Candidatus Baltobacteraceae bacterium]|jgi:hypothetical protein|nr:hypothetical protein [Candidatus Baltobacteraceae bacterium]
MCLSYGDVIATLSLIVEAAILVYVIKEFKHLTSEVKEIREAASGPIYSSTDDFTVGTPVAVLQPQPGVPREKWQYSTEVYVIREVDKVRNWALATSRLPPVQGPTPTVSGQMSGPNSPFKKLSIPS